MKIAVKVFAEYVRLGQYTKHKAITYLDALCSQYGTEAVASELVRIAPDVCAWLNN